jgi:hypothetical protein
MLRTQAGEPPMWIEAGALIGVIIAGIVQERRGPPDQPASLQPLHPVNEDN